MQQEHERIALGGIVAGGHVQVISHRGAPALPEDVRDIAIHRAVSAHSRAGADGPCAPDQDHEHQRRPAPEPASTKCLHAGMSLYLSLPASSLGAETAAKAGM